MRSLKTTNRSAIACAPFHVLQPLGQDSRDGLAKLTFILLWCFIASVPFETTLMIPGLGTISRVIGIVLLPVGLLAICARGWLRRLHLPHWCMIAFIAWISLSYFWTVSQVSTSERIFTEVQLLLVVLIAWQFCTSEKGARMLMEAYVYGTLVSCGETIYRFGSHEYTYYGRFSALGFDPNDLSLTLAISIPISYYLFLRHRGWKSCFWIFQISAVILTCLLTASRMGALVIVLALSITLLTVKSLNRWCRAALATIAALVIVLCITFVPASSWHRLSTLGTEVSTGTLNSRTEIWAGGWSALESKPFAGVGAGAFADAVEPMISYFDVGHAFVAHNTFLSVLVELGTFGFILFLLLLATLAATVLKMESLLRKTYLVTFLVWGVGVTTLTWEHRKPTWVLFALALQTLDSRAHSFVSARTQTSLMTALRTPNFFVSRKL